MKKLEFIVWLVAAGLLGCDRDHHHDHSGHAGHTHAAPNGGTLVVLGDEACHLELVHDAASGQLTLYAHQFHPQRAYMKIPMAQIEVNATVTSESQVLVLKAVANETLGNSATNSSEFATATPWLKGRKGFAGTIARVEIGGQAFTNKTFTLP
ncbi:MAG: hypothetical protein EXS22_11090 [Pedosphaera sp.]|nr:hypothetical protein [Pedosphaera sp.]